MHSETLGFFPKGPCEFGLFCSNFLSFLYAFQLAISNCLESLTDIFSSSCVTSILISVFFKAANEIIIPKNKCVLDGIRNSGVVHRLRSFTAGLSR